MTKQFEVTNYLETPEDLAAYLDEAFGTGDPEFIMTAIGDVLKTKVISEVAARAEINRVSLHKAIAERRDTRISTIASILRALDCRLSVVPIKKVV